MHNSLRVFACKWPLTISVQSPMMVSMKESGLNPKNCAEYSICSRFLGSTIWSIFEKVFEVLLLSKLKSNNLQQIFEILIFIICFVYRWMCAAFSLKIERQNSDFFLGDGVTNNIIAIADRWTNVIQNVCSSTSRTVSDKTL